MSPDADARRCSGRGPAGGNADALEAQRKLLVDRVRNLFQLVRGGEGEYAFRKKGSRI